MSESSEFVAGRYRLTSQIGSGGMGRVWLARDEVLHRDVAVKEVVLPDELTDAERNELCQRTLREARAAGRLNHPSVVSVYDVVQAQGRPWIVMELVRSRSLYQVVREQGPVSPRRAAEIGLSVLAALREAHRAGVWHRDVKPGNVLLAEDGRVVLTDFGLATYDGDGTVTRAGLILGSAQYISPERARDGVSGPESDMWSLGATLYAAVEGRSPFARDTSMATLTALATAPPDAPRRAGPLRPVLIGLLRKNPKHRMRAAETEKLLRRIADGDGVRTHAPGRVPRSHRAADKWAELNDAGLNDAEFNGAGLNDAEPNDAELNDAELNDAVASPTGGAGGDRTGRRASDGGAVLAHPPPRLQTATEETYPYVAPRRRRWPWVVVGIAALLAVPAAAIALDSQGWLAGSPSAPTLTVSPTAGSSEPVLTAAMGVQACLAQSPARETVVRPGPTVLAGGWSVLDPEKYAAYEDRSGFQIAAPIGWGLSQIDPLVCFRDRTSLRAIAVYSHGAVLGDPITLLEQGEAPWRQAARFEQYDRVDLRYVDVAQGGADLEYTYVRDGLKMHGENRIQRMGGEVYTIFWLTTDFSWNTDRELRDFIQPSFGLKP